MKSDGKKKYGRLLSIAKTNGRSIAFFSLMVVAFSLLTKDGWSAFLGALVLISGGMELWGRQLLIEKDSRARIILPLSQAYLFFIIAGYSAFKLVSFHSSDILSTVSPEIMSQLVMVVGNDMSSLTELLSTVYHAVYISILAVTLIYQGGLFLYYRRGVSRILTDGDSGA